MALEHSLEEEMVYLDLEQILVLMVEMDLGDQLVELEEASQEVFLVELMIVTMLLILEIMMM